VREAKKSSFGECFDTAEAKGSSGLGSCTMILTSLSLFIVFRRPCWGSSVFGDEGRCSGHFSVCVVELLSRFEGISFVFRHAMLPFARLPPALLVLKQVKKGKRLTKRRCCITSQGLVPAWSASPWLGPSTRVLGVLDLKSCLGCWI